MWGIKTEHMGRVALLACFMAWSGGAEAAIHWCDFIPILPGDGVDFAQTAAGVDAMGCVKVPQESAHTRSWRCSDQEANDTFVYLTHLVGGYGSEPNLLIVSNSGLADFARLRACGPSAVPASGSVGAFDSSSIALKDRVTITRRYLPQQVYLVGIGTENNLVAFYPERFESMPMLEAAEQIMFGYQRPSSPTTQVEVAGKNLIASPADEVISALESRGARVTSREQPTPLRSDTHLTPPLGLEGVTKVTIGAFERHVADVEYTLTGLQDYMAYVALLDGRYGTSTAENGAGESKACRNRYWQSGNISILGEYCPPDDYRIGFFNDVVSDELEAYRELLRRPPDRSPRRTIDPDNL
jgi:hypothetical protein